MIDLDPNEDVCDVCGQHIGYGHQAFHLGNCGAPECKPKKTTAVPKGKSLKGKLGKAKGVSDA